MIYTAIIGGIGLCVTILGLIARISWILSELKTKVDTLWEAQLLDWQSQANKAGLMVKNSPIQTTDKLLKEYGDLYHELKIYYDSIGKEISEEELIYLIVKEYGKQIFETAYKDFGACVAALAHAVKTNEFIKSK